MSSRRTLVAYAPGGREKDRESVPWLRDQAKSFNLIRNARRSPRNPHIAPASLKLSGVAPQFETTARSIAPGSPEAHGARDPNSIPVGLISNRSARGCSMAGSVT